MTGLRVADRALIAGDSLFADGIARPDLAAGRRRRARARWPACCTPRCTTACCRWATTSCCCPATPTPACTRRRSPRPSRTCARAVARAGDRRPRRLRRRPARAHAAATGQLRGRHRRQRRHPFLRPRAGDGRQQLLDPLRSTEAPQPDPDRPRRADRPAPARHRRRQPDPHPRPAARRRAVGRPAHRAPRHQPAERLQAPRRAAAGRHRGAPQGGHELLLPRRGRGRLRALRAGLRRPAAQLAELTAMVEGTR